MSVKEATMARTKEKRSAADKHRLTVYLDPGTHLALMRRALDESEAAAERVSATQIVERLIEQYLKKGPRT
jgi:hypothetical protein